MSLGLAIEPYPISGAARLVAAITLSGSTAATDVLSTSIGMRCTNRKKGDARAMPLTLLKDLRAATTQVEGCDAHFITQRDQLSRVAEIIANAERVRVLNPVGHHELFRKEMRWSREEAAHTRDGLDLPTMELKLTEEVGFRVAADRKAMDLLAEWDTGRAFMKMTREAIASSSAIALVTCSRSDPRALLDAGRAVQRLWLQASALGLAVTPCAAPILLAHHVRFGNGLGMNDRERSSLLELLQDLKDAFAINEREPVFMLRLAFAAVPTARSARKPIEDFFFAHQLATA